MRRQMFLLEKQKLPYKVLTAIMISFCVIEFICIAIYNLNYDISRIGTDSAGFLELSKLMWEQKKLLVDNWEYQTTLMIDSPAPIAAIFYGITGNQFLSYGLATTVTTILLIVVFCSILTEYALPTSIRAMILGIFILPISTWDLGYFTIVLGGYAPYAIKILCGLLIFKCILVQKNGSITNKIFRYSLYLITCILTFLVSFSSGVFIITLVLLPLIIEKAIEFFAEDNVKALFTNKYLLLFVFCASAVCGVLASNVLIGFASRDTSIMLVNSDQLFGNFFYVLQGYIELFSGLPGSGSQVSVLSGNGIKAIFGLLLVFALFMCFIFFAARVLKQFKKEVVNVDLCFPIISMLYTILLYTFINTSYGNAYFETRYLIFSVLFLLPLCGKFLVLLPRIVHKKLFNQVMVVGVCITIFANGFVGFQKVYAEKFTDEEKLEQIIAKMDELNAEIIYFYGNDTQKDTQTILVADTSDRVYDCLFENMSSIHWGNSIEHRVHYQEELSSVILTKSDSLFQQMPYGITRFYTHVGQVAEYQIYYSDGNYVQFATTLPEKDGETITIQPYSVGIQTTNGTFTDEGFVTDGAGGYATWGPYTAAPVGTYEFTLHYEVKECLSEVAGQFDVAVNATPMGVVDLQAGENTATLEVTFDENSAGGSLEYRSMINEGTVIALKSVEIKKIS